MSDIVVSVNEQKLKELLEIYKKNFWGIHWEEEKYKWEAVACFQDNWNIDASDFMKMFVKATKEANPTTGSLINSWHNKALEDLKNIYKYKPEEVKQLFINLYNEELSVEERISSFLAESDRLREDCPKIKSQFSQKDVVMTYLWLMYPDKYYIYKNDSCAILSKMVTSNYKPLDGSIEVVLDSLKFFDVIRQVVKEDVDILKLLQDCDSKIKFVNFDCKFAKKDYNKWLNTLVSDFAFYIKRRVEEEKDKFKKWALKKGNSTGIKDATVNGYISALDRMWKKSNVADKMESPYAYGSEDIEELKGLYSDFDKNGDMADSDSKTGFKWYLEFLQGSEVVISDDENKDGKSKELNNKYPKNLILYGPPGTGKTYNTVLKAMNIIAPEKNYNDSNYTEAKAEYDKLTEEGRIQFVTFHQSYGYEEFIQGIKAKTDKGNISYLVEDGIFKKFCDSARGKKDDKGNSIPYIFIIDEINRGNISKIFGELITLIEDTKREGEDEATSAILPYPDNSGNPVKFTVPDNVFIIGTMNTADRSLAVVDTALRRRFTFEEMMPKPAKLQGIEGINISILLEVMNERITALYDREHTIGHAYFMGLSGNSTIKDLGEIFRNKIIPLLQEYFYEDYEKIRLVFGDNQKDNKETQFIQKEESEVIDLFGNNNDLNIDKVISYSINEKAFYEPDAYKYFKQKNKVDTQNKTQESQGSNT